MKPPKFEYFAPASLDETTALLDRYGDEAKVLAGGQSLMPLLNMRLVRPQAIVDINRVTQLDYIAPAPDGSLAIGALTRQRTVERSAIVRQHSPLLAEALPFIAHFPIRNRGTVGGSIVHADPAAELPAIGVTLEADLVLSGSGSQRVLKAADFFLGYLTTALEPGEVLTELRVPVLDGGWGWGFAEVSRRHGDFAMVGAATLLRLDENDSCAAARITMFGVGGAPVRVTRAEEMLAGQPVDSRALEDVAKVVSEAIDPSGDIHASVEYRREVGGTLARRTVEAALGRARGGAKL